MADLQAALQACARSKHPAFCRHHVVRSGRHAFATARVVSRPGELSPQERGHLRAKRFLRSPWVERPRTAGKHASPSWPSSKTRRLPRRVDGHRLPHVGVTHFYLYDDESDDEPQAVLDPYVTAGTVQSSVDSLARCPPRSKACSRATRAGKPSSAPATTAGGCSSFRSSRPPFATRSRPTHEPEWMAWIDVDEFLRTSRT